MTTELLDALLWRSRAAIRVDGLPTHAGHGLADPLYRPPRLPYASVLGPLSYAVEPERDLPRRHALSVRTPGYLAGASRDPATDVLPPPGDVTVLVDDEVVVALALDHGPDEGLPLDADRGEALAARMQAAFDVALAGGVADLDGVPVEAPRVEELSRTTIRWDGPHARLVIASGRYGPVGDAAAGSTSSVRLAADAPTDHAAALGLTDGDPLADPPVPGAVTPEGRIVRHQVPSPVAMSFDMRVDLWAGSQRHLAALVEAWARVTPTRCQLVLRPALLEADLAAGDQEIPLQAVGEPPTRWTIAQLEPGVEFADRRSGASVELSGGAAPQADGLLLPVGGRATLRLLPASAIPDPFAPTHPASTGWALALNVRVPAPPGAEGQMMIAELEHAGRSALRIDLAWERDNGRLQARVEVNAETAEGVALDPAVLDVSDGALAEGVEVHALVDAVQGQVAGFADGEAAVGAGRDPVDVPGGSDVVLRIGAAGALVECTVGHVQVLTRPLGPLDHRQRRALATSDRWRPGDPVTLARTDDGFTPKGNSFTAIVVEVTDNRLLLDRPVVGNWSRFDTLVGSRVVFSQQTQVRRRDELASNIARMSISHTVSAFVDPLDAGTSARLVEAMDLQIRDRAVAVVPDEEGGATAPSTRRHDGAPTVVGEFVPARVLVVHAPEGEEPPAADQIERVPEAPSPDPPA